MADYPSSIHRVAIAEDGHVWLSTAAWRLDVTQVKADRDRYREMLEAVRALCESSTTGMVAVSALTTALSKEERMP